MTDTRVITGSKNMIPKIDFLPKALFLLGSATRSQLMQGGYWLNPNPASERLLQCAVYVHLLIEWIAQKLIC